MTDSHHWYLLGAGAIGTLLTRQMREAGIDCTLLHHRGSAERILQVDGHRHVIAAQALHGQVSNSIGCLLLTTKAGQLAAALDAASPYLADNAIIATTANGLGFERDLRRSARGNPLFRAVSTEAAYRDGDDTVVYAGRGETRIGCPGSSLPAPEWFDASLARLDRWSWDPRIDARLHRKFAINCIINPLTALFRCRNGDLLQVEKYRQQMNLLCRESETAMRTLRLWVGEEPLLSAVEAVCRSTRGNRSSMLQDVLARRATELPFLNGELLRRATARGLGLPHNEQLLQALDEKPAAPVNR